MLNFLFTPKQNVANKEESKQYLALLQILETIHKRALKDRDKLRTKYGGFAWFSDYVYEGLQPELVGRRNAESVKTFKRLIAPMVEAYLEAEELYGSDERE